MKKYIIFFFIFFFIPFKLVAKENYYYLALGDSITSGYGVNVNETYPYYIYSYLLNDYNVFFSNEAISGYNTDQMLYLLENNDIINKIKESNLITISIGSNDILNHLNISIINNDLTSLKNIIDNKIPQTKTNLKDIINTIRSINSTTKIVIIPFYNPYNSLSDISIFNNAINLLNEYKNDLNNYIKDIIKNNNNIYCFNEIENILEQEEYVNVNIENNNYDPHPNNLGHKKISEIIISSTIFDSPKKITNTNNYIIYFAITIIVIIIIVLSCLTFKRLK